MKKKFIKNQDWFFEDYFGLQPRDLAWGFEIKKEIYSGKSPYQNFQIFDTKELGRVLVLDGFVQLTTKHEFIYHEMLVHPAIASHKSPKNILVVGGGDGGVLREIFKYPVKEVILCDIDKKVIDISKKYFPSVSKGSFNDKRLKIFNEDAFVLIDNYKNYFDVIIDDITDPTGPSTGIWEKKFYEKALNSLKSDGIFCSQTGLVNENFAKKARKIIGEVFSFSKTLRVFINSFPFEEFTFTIASKKIDFNKIKEEEIKKNFEKLKIKTNYYSPKIYFSSMVFPRYLEESGNF